MANLIFLLIVAVGVARKNAKLYNAEIIISALFYESLFKCGMWKGYIASFIMNETCMNLDISVL